jgi:pantothenate kinase-related protein Tda10
MDSSILTDFILRNELFGKDKTIKICIDEEDKLTKLLYKYDNDILSKKMAIYKLIYPSLCEFIVAQSFNKEKFLKTAWKFYLPFCLDLRRKMDINPERPLIIGILGVMGAGKTTLTFTITLIMTVLMKRVFSFSIDDIYKTHEDREKLKAQDPRFYMRGPPGTHDIELAERIFIEAQKGLLVI